MEQKAKFAREHGEKSGLEEGTEKMFGWIRSICRMCVWALATATIAACASATKDRAPATQERLERTETSIDRYKRYTDPTFSDRADAGLTDKTGSVRR